MAVYIAWNAEPSLYQRLTSLLSKGAAMLGDEVACPALEGVNSIWNSCVLNAVLHALKTISLCSQNGHVHRYRTAHQANEHLLKNKTRSTSVELGPQKNQSSEPPSDDCCFSTPTKKANTASRLEAPSPLCKENVGSKKPDPYSPAKRSDYVSWDEYFMAVAYLSAARSKDPNRQ
eukprot:4438253-Pyramimonas_sp.AAC.1